MICKTILLTYLYRVKHVSNFKTKSNEKLIFGYNLKTNKIKKSKGQ